MNNNFNIRKILGVFLIGIFNLCVVAQNVESSHQSLSEKDRSFYNALYSTDCSIPEGTQVLHYPMLHMDSSNRIKNLEEVLRFEVRENISRSQWKLVQLIHQYPDVLLFDEKFTFKREADSAHEDFDKTLNNIRDSYSPPIANLGQTILDDIASAKSFEALSALSKKALYYGGSGVALHLNDIKHVYPVTPLSSLDEMSARYWESVNMSSGNAELRVSEIDNEINSLNEQFEKAKSIGNRVDMLQIVLTLKDLSNELRHLYEVFNGRIFDFQFRENLLAESVHHTLNDKANEDKMVLIAYGAGHDLSDNFKEYSFYRLPYSCSFLEAESFSFLNVLNVVSLMKTRPGEVNQEIVHSYVRDTIDRMPSEELKLLMSVLDMTFDEEPDTEVMKELFKTVINYILENDS